MCEPATIIAAASLVIATASTGVSYVSQQNAADAEYDSKVNAIQQQEQLTHQSVRDQYSASLLRIQQEREAASDQKFEEQKNYIQAYSAAETAAGENGVSGFSVDALLNDYSRTFLGNQAMTDRNFEMKTDQVFEDMRGIQAQGNQTLASVDRGPVQGPSAAAAALKVGQAAVSSYGMYKNLKSYEAKPPGKG